MELNDISFRTKCRVTHEIQERPGHNRLIMSNSTLKELNQLRRAVLCGDNPRAVLAEYTAGSLSEHRSPITYQQAIEFVMAYPEIFEVREEYVRKIKKCKNRKKNKNDNRQDIDELINASPETRQKLESLRSQKAIVEKYGKRKRRRKHGRKNSGVISNIVKAKDERIGMYNYGRSKNRERLYLKNGTRNRKSSRKRRR